METHTVNKSGLRSGWPGQYIHYDKGEDPEKNRQIVANRKQPILETGVQQSSHQHQHQRDGIMRGIASAAQVEADTDYRMRDQNYESHEWKNSQQPNPFR